MPPQPILPPGSTLLITGASSYIGSHIIAEALALSYKVVGTFRTADKARASTTALGNNSNYTTLLIPDAHDKDAYFNAMQGCSAIIHLASNVSMSPDSNLVVQPTVDQVLDILHAATRTPSIQRFVYCSSSTATLFPGNKTVTTSDWNQDALDAAFAPPPYTPDRGYAVYGASKVKAEQALWSFKDAHFVINSVVPDMNTGKIIDGAGSTGSFIPSLLKGQRPFAPAQYYVDVQDTARLHLIAAIDGDVERERIFAFAHPFTWREIVGIIKEAYPHVADKLPVYKPEDEVEDKSVVPNELGAQLLKKWYGQNGFKPLKQTVLENLEGQI